MSDELDDWIKKFLGRVGAPDEARFHMGPADRDHVKRWLEGMDPVLRARFLDGDTDHPVVPFGKASLRYVPGQGYVQVPHLYRITFRAPVGGDVSYEVQTFLGREKAVSMATEAHSLRKRPWHDMDVEELGPTEAGGSSSATDDRAEW